MAPKRKLLDQGSPTMTASAESRPEEPASQLGYGQPHQHQHQQHLKRAIATPVPLPSVENYPRKRISIACNLCRFRKTKCDAVRPTCGFCAGLGVQCQYRESVHASAAAKESRSRSFQSRQDQQPQFREPVSVSVPPPPPPPPPGHVTSLEKRLLELEAKWAELEKRSLDSAISPGAADGFVGRPVDRDMAPQPPSGSIPLAGMLGGPSPPASTTDSIGNINDTSLAISGSSSIRIVDAARHQYLREGPDPSPSTMLAAAGGSHRKADLARQQAPPGQYTARPSLLTFDSPGYVRAESWDDSGEFYDAEMAAGDEFNRHTSQCLAVFPDVSKRTVRLVLQSFVENFLGWMPLFEATAVYTIVNVACASSFAPSDPNSCLAMLILATGTMLQSHADIRSNPPPGLDYFAHGSRYLERFAFTTSSLTALHCRILQAAYFKLTLHPLLSWNTTMQATRDCMNVLSSRWWKSLDPAAREPWHRAFWACSVMADEHEASMRLHTVGHRMFHELVPLPRFEIEDTGFYYFLAQISLRKLVTATLDVVGYHDGKVVYAPVVTTELRNQAREWHCHLPVAIRFPLDSSPLFDARKSFLRLQYFSLNAVLEWASVLRVMEAYGTAQEVSDEIALARIEAVECFRFSTLYLDVAAEQLLSWRLGTCISIWTTFVFLASLIVSYKAPALAFIPVTRDPTHVRNALELLRPWSHVPFVAIGLERMSGIMKRIGISP